MLAVKDHRPLLHTRPFDGPFSGTTRVSRYQKGKTNLDFTEARDSEWQWHQLGHMQVCTLLQTDNHASNPPLKFFTGRMPFLLPNQQCQSTEGIYNISTIYSTSPLNKLQYILAMRIHKKLRSQRESYGITTSLFYGTDTIPVVK